MRGSEVYKSQTEPLIKTELQSQAQLAKLYAQGWKLVAATQRSSGQPYLVFEKVKT